METTVMEQEQTALGTSKHVAAYTVLQRSVVLRLLCYGMGNDRVIDLEDVGKLVDRDTGEELKDEAAAIRATHELFPPDMLRPVTNLFDAAKKYVRARSTRGQRVFGAGTYIIGKALAAEVDAELLRFADLVMAAAGVLADAVPEAMREAERRQGKVFDAKKYPSQDRVRRMFRLDWRYVNVTAPDKLEDISHVLAQRANARYEADLATAYEDIVVGLRTDALQVFRSLADRLAPNKDGKRKALYPGALDELQAYVALLPRRNSVAGDDALVQAVAEVARYAEGLDVETLRKAPAVRGQFEALVQRTQEALAQLVQDAPVRGISFGGTL